MELVFVSLSCFFQPMWVCKYAPVLLDRALKHPVQRTCLQMHLFFCFFGNAVFLANNVFIICIVSFARYMFLLAGVCVCVRLFMLGQIIVS